MNLGTKVMALAVLVLAAGAANAAPTNLVQVSAAGSPAEADNTAVITISLANGVPGTTYAITTNPATTTISGSISFDAGGVPSGTVTIKTSTSGVYLVTADNGAGDSNTTKVIFQHAKLTITITVTIAAAVDVQFVDNSGSAGSTVYAKNWDLLNSTLGQSYNATASSVNTNIKNNGAFRVDLTVALTQNFANWPAGAAAGPDTVAVNATDNGGGTVGPLTVAGGAQGYGFILANQQQNATNLKLDLPTTVQTLNPGSTMVVTYVAAAH